MSKRLVIGGALLALASLASLATSSDALAQEDRHEKARLGREVEDFSLTDRNRFQLRKAEVFR